ncbi:putative transcription factor C3H family [Medicago truncatula]|uniref:Putative transcription factor C3H family n=1 Tax=Medicago truncatula TaxID=3880 RepID=A0A396IT50_MEDTR|nr:putative transcription factor C3H family [Medicago truncatula]
MCVLNCLHLLLKIVDVNVNNHRRVYKTVTAKDDVLAFTDAVEKGEHEVDEVGLWYGRRVGSKDMGYEERTALMVAALFGSKGVLSYILGTSRVDVNRVCGSDRATALRCAVSGCSAASAEVINLSLDASADRILRSILEGVDDVDFLKEVGFQLVEQQQNVATPRTEKKDYPINPSLPDINNEIYSTDEFRMGNARRRDSRKYHYTCVPCPEFRKGSCRKGDACEYAHGIFECWLHPAQYITRLCKDETRCTRRVCFFAHKPEELRPLYASTGCPLPSPTSYSNSPCASSMDSFTLSSPSSSIQSAPTPPLIPSASSPATGTMWQTQIQLHAAVPTLQMPRNRLKTVLNAGNNIEFLELENRLSLSSPSNRLARVNPTNLENFFGSSIQSPTTMQMHQNAN